MKKAYIKGNIYTVTNGFKESMLIEDGKIIAIDTHRAIDQLIDESTEVIDLNGKFVTAGFNDSHMHLLGLGYTLEMANLAQHTTSLEDIQNYMRTFIEKLKPEPHTWVRGRGWNHDYFTDEKRFPTRYDLDQITTEVPLCLIRACGHLCVVNSKALERAAITGDTPQVEGGVFDLDAQGEPTGIFRENALKLIYNNIPTPTKDDLKEMIKKSCQLLNQYGVTSAQTDDFTIFPEVTYKEIIQAYQELEQSGALSVRVYQQAQLIDEKELQAFLSEGYTTGVGTDFFKIGPLKMLGDGSLGARTAYMSVPYADEPTTRGIAIYTQQQFDHMIMKAHNHGMQVAIHGIGDGIIYRIIEAIEKALKQNPRKDHRHGIVHCQITTPEILQKFKELNICAYIQSIFLDYDINIVEERVGKERASTSYQFKTLLNQENIVANGSDSPVEPPDVLAGIQCSITRKTLDGSKGPYLLEQALTIEEAMSTYTMMGAYTSFEESLKGSLEVGKVADFVVLDENLFECQVDKIKDIQVLQTVVAGQCVYQKMNQ